MCLAITVQKHRRDRKGCGLSSFPWRGFWRLPFGGDRALHRTVSPVIVFAGGNHMECLRILDKLLVRMFYSSSSSDFLTNAWYSYVTKLDRVGEALFLNYGYAGENDGTVQLKSADEANRFSIQLYHHIATSVPLKERDVVEVGCGRGGGASYIARYLAPKFLVAIDICEAAIRFNERHYRNQRNVKFIVGDAHNLPLGDNRYDVIMNVESSHHYSGMEQFLAEVYRVIKASGYFLMACFRKRNEVLHLKEDLLGSGMVLIKEEDITSNVIKALDLDNERRVKLMGKLVPRILRKAAEEFAGIKGSKLYDTFVTRERIYLNYVLQKPY